MDASQSAPPGAAVKGITNPFANELKGRFVRLFSPKSGEREMLVEWNILETVLLRMGDAGVFGPVTSSLQTIQPTFPARAPPQSTCPPPKLLASNGAPDQQFTNVKRLPTKTYSQGKRNKRAELHLDGYKWRKYGQKFLTFSRQYREYFRCSFPGCPAKRQLEIEPETGTVVTSSSTAHNHGINDTQVVLEDSGPTKSKINNNKRDSAHAQLVPSSSKQPA